jgi:DNA-directed RNA polymerase subunit H (RpoH/RPB5)
MSSYEKLHKTYKSRRNILDILRRIGYDTTDYEDFDENEVSIMIETEQLDMILYKVKRGGGGGGGGGGSDGENVKGDLLDGGSGTKEKILVKYNINVSKINSDQSFELKINEYFEEKQDEFYLNKNDILMMIVDTEITDKIQERLRTIYENRGHFVVMHNIARLQLNILNHVLNPKSFYILDENEIAEFKKNYYLKNVNEIPEISRFDPYALAICLKPGQICKITRTSVNSLDYDSWVYCL